MDNRPALRPSSRSSTRAAPNPIDPTVITVSDLSVALIREFLVAKGHRRTLEVFGQEEPLVRFVAFSLLVYT